MRLFLASKIDIVVSSKIHPVEIADKPDDLFSVTLLSFKDDKSDNLFSVTLLAPAFFNLSDALEVPGAVKVRIDLNLSFITRLFFIDSFRKSQAYVLYGLLWNLGTKATPKDESGQKVSSLLTFPISNCWNII